MAWRLPDGKTISTPRGVVIGDVRYSADIFYRWSKQELAAIGIKPFREEQFDSKWYRSSGSSEATVDGEIVKTHTTVERYTNQEAQDNQLNVIRDRYIVEVRRANELADFYDASGDNVIKKVWSDYVIALKNDAKDLKDAVDAAGTYDAIINLNFQWTEAPDHGSI